MEGQGAVHGDISSSASDRTGRHQTKSNFFIFSSVVIHRKLRNVITNTVEYTKWDHDLWDHSVNGINFSKVFKACFAFLVQSVNQSVCRLLVSFGLWNQSQSSAHCNYIIRFVIKLTLVDEVK
jgi:hypothetical protein